MDKNQLKMVCALFSATYLGFSRQLPGLQFLGSRCSSPAGSAIEEDDKEEVEDPKGRRDQDSADLSDEEVFEGCVQEDEASGHEPLWEEGGPPTSPEVPAHMMTELKGVLTVRNHEREKRRLLRRHGGCTGEPATPTLQQEGGQLATPTLQQGGRGPATPTLQQGDTSPSNSPEPATERSLQEPTNSQVSKPSQTTKSEVPLPGEHPHLATPPITYCHALSSEMAAAIRLRRQIQNEQTYS